MRSTGFVVSLGPFVPFPPLSPSPSGFPPVSWLSFSQPYSITIQTSLGHTPRHPLLALHSFAFTTNILHTNVSTSWISLCGPSRTPVPGQAPACALGIAPRIQVRRSLIGHNAHKHRLLCNHQFPNIRFDDDKRQSGFGALGMGLMNMDDDSDDEDGPAMQVPPARTSHRSPPTPDLKQAPGAIPLAAPRPGYVAQAINLARPPPSATPNGRSRADDEKAQLCGAPPAYAPSTPGTPRGPPSSPHPLNLPVTPIQPVFARPRKQEERDVKFSSGIIRGNKEDALIPRRGEKGDDFWRRFSMVAHDQATKSPKEKER